MGTAMLPQGQAMYVAPKSDWTWLLNEQRKLYRRSWEKPEYVFEKLWGLVTDPRNLRMAVARVASNRGRRTGGVDRVTVRMVVRDGVLSTNSSPRFSHEFAPTWSLEKAATREQSGLLMLPMTLQFVIAMIASAINDRLQRKLD